jgi:hypothetical protein
MEFIFVCIIIVCLFVLTFSFYIKIFIIDFPQRNESYLYFNDWDSFDIAVHYLNFVLNKYMKKNINSSVSFQGAQIPGYVTEQWTSIWYQANSHLIHINEVRKKDLELLIMNMKSKAIDLGLFKYNINRMNSLPLRLIIR